MKETLGLFASPRTLLDSAVSPKGHGVILLVYSCLFTRGLEQVRRDMDNGFGTPTTMMARHGYASQVGLFLLLTSS